MLIEEPDQTESIVLRRIRKEVPIAIGIG